MTFESNYDDALDIVEKIAVMKKQEKHYGCTGYLENTTGTSVIDGLCRSRMCDWCYRTVDFFKLSRDCVPIAMSYLDRFLCTSLGRPYMSSKEAYQVACVTALHMATKIHGPVELGIAALVQLGRGAYSAEEIVEAEESILIAINWRVNPPCATAFVELLVSILPPSVSTTSRNEILNLAHEQISASLRDYTVGALSRPSTVAVASLMNAFAMLPKIPSSTFKIFFQYVEQLMGYRQHQIKVGAMRALLLEMLDEANTRKHKEEDQRIRRSSLKKKATTVSSKGSQRSLARGTMSPVAVAGALR
jgi:hypothetical protein